MILQSGLMRNCTTPRQMELLNTMRRLWTEHVMWTRFAIESTAFDLANADEVTKRLLQNPADFARVLRLFYGYQKASKFETLFTEHLLIAANLVGAAKAGDEKKADEERKKWYANADEIAAFLSRINPYWNEKMWQEMMYDHLKMTEDEVVQILTGQYAKSISQFDLIQEEALKMADEMAHGIIRQFKI